MLVIACSRASFWTNHVEETLKGITFRRLTTKEDLTFKSLQAIQPEVIFFPYWKWKIPELIWAKWPSVVFHLGPLPEARGGSPLQYLIRGGFTEAPVNALLAQEELDSGPVLASRTVSLRGSAREIFSRVSEEVALLITELSLGFPPGRYQSGPTAIQKRLKPADNELKPDLSMIEIYDEIRMVDSPDYLPAFIRFGSYDIEFSNCRYGDGHLAGDFRIVNHLTERDG